MPGATRGNSVDSVLSATGSGTNCASPLVTSTDACSSNVFVNNTGVVRIGDSVTSHTKSGCGNEAPGLSSSSTNVFINSKGTGRLGDNYAGDGSNIITSSSSNVFVNG